MQALFTVDGRFVSNGAVSDEFHQTLGLNLVNGRWFGEEDAALDWEPIVITQPLSEALFGSEDPIGQKIEEWQGSNERIIGWSLTIAAPGVFRSRFLRVHFARVKEKIAAIFWSKCVPVRRWWPKSKSTSGSRP